MGSQHRLAPLTIFITVLMLILGTASPARAQAGLLVYVANQGLNNVSAFRINADGTLTPVGTVAVGTTPFGVVVRADQAFAYVTNFGTDNVSVIDSKTQTVVQTIAAGDGPRGLALNPDNTRLYVANNNGGANSVSVYSIADGTGLLALETTLTSGLNGPRHLAVTPDGSRLYVVNQGGDSVRVFDTATNSALTTIAVGDQPLNVALNPAGTRGYVTNFSDSTVSVIDTSSNTVVATPALGAGSGPSNVMVSPDGSYYYVANSTAGTIAQFAASTNTTIAAPISTSGATVFGLGATPVGGFVYATNQQNDLIARFSIGAGGALSSLGTHATGGSSDPTGLGICPGNGNRLLASGRTFVANMAAAMECTNNDPIFTGGTLLINADSIVFPGGFTIDSGGATIDTNGHDAEFQAVFQGANGLTKNGTGTLILSGINSQPGPIVVNAGALRVNGPLGTASSIAVRSGATLEGANVVNAAVTVDGGGTLSPGNPGGSPGMLTAAGLTLSVSSTLAITLNGPAAVSEHDVVGVAGGVTVDNATLTLAPTFTAALGQVFTIVDNDGTDAIVGTFLGLPQAATFSSGGQAFRISYTGGTGNDVTITAVATGTKADQTITFAALPNRTLGDPPFTVSATASSGLTVTFSSLTPSVCTVSGNTVTLVAAGTCTIAADQAGDANYNAAPQVTRSFTVASNCSSLNITPAQLPFGLVGLSYSQTLTLAGGTAPVTWAQSGTLPGGVTFTNGVLSGKPTARGSFPITVTATDANSCQASASLTLAISAERRLLAGAGAGGGGAARAFNLSGSTPVMTTNSGTGFNGGTSVAEGDVDGNGFADVITGAGPGAGPAVTVFDGFSGGVRLAFFAFPSTFAGGVEVAAGDINGDGLADILAVQGCGSGSSSVVRAFDGRTGTQVREYAVAASVSSCGLHVAAGDVNGDGTADLVVGSAGLGPAFVRVIDGSSGALIREFFPYSTAYTGGVFVAAGDVNGDGFADVVSGAGPGGTPHVRVFDGVTGNQIAGALGSFLAYAPGFSGGVRVAAGDLNGDGRAEVITGAGPGGGPHVRVFDGATTSEVLGMFAFDASHTGGVFVAAPAPSAHIGVDIAARTTGTEVRVAGWALRTIAGDTTGNDAIHVWALPVAGGTPVFVGAAPSRVARPDVAAFFGGEFLMSGFNFTGTLAPGTYDLIVFARNSRTLKFDQARVIRVTVQ